VSFDSFYRLNWRRVMVHPYTGELVVCSADDGLQHDSSHEAYADSCEDCQSIVLACRVCQRCISCCPCGNYHSMDCDWPL
jgi:hypothetical protein